MNTNKKELLTYLHGYLTSLKKIKNGHYDNFQYINQIIAKNSNDELLKMHRDFKDKFDQEMLDKHFEVHYGPQDVFDYQNNDQSNSNNDSYNSDLDLDQQHPDFYV